MCMLSERLQILLDPERRRRLEAEAAARGSSVAALIREAIDAIFPATSDERRQAGDRLLDADPMPVPHEIGALRDELEALRSRRAT